MKRKKRHSTIKTKGGDFATLAAWEASLRDDEEATAEVKEG